MTGEKGRVDAVVVGAVNMDLGGHAHGPLVAGDSNPGRVRAGLGGVGRNIAHNLALLGAGTGLVAALGDDLYAKEIVSSCAALGIDLSQAPAFPGETTSTYLFIAGPDGDMALALSDMALCGRLTPELLAGRREYLNGARLVVAEANLPADSLAWLADNVDVPLFADPVSAAKAPKLRPLLGRLHTLKPNRLEAELLSGVAITGEDSLERAAAALLATGLERVFISLGADGVYAAGRTGERFRLPAIPGRAVDATGCGDAFMAALAWAWLEGLGLEDSARAGLAAAAIARESGGAVNPALTSARIRER